MSGWRKASESVSPRHNQFSHGSPNGVLNSGSIAYQLGINSGKLFSFIWLIKFERQRLIASAGSLASVNGPCRSVKEALNYCFLVRESRPRGWEGRAAAYTVVRVVRKREQRQTKEKTRLNYARGMVPA